MIAPQFAINRFQHSIQISIDVVVPESQRAKIPTRKTRIAFDVTAVVAVKIVLTAVYLDNEALAHADKINDVTLAWRLPTKVEATLSPRTKMNPQFHFLWRHRLP